MKLILLLCLTLLLRSLSFLYTFVSGKCAREKVRSQQGTRGKPTSLLPFLVPTASILQEDMPLIPGTCHTPHTNELGSSKPSVISSLAELVSSSDTQAAGYALSAQGSRNTLCLQKVATTSHHAFVGVAHTRADSFQLGSRYPSTLISFWYERLLQTPN